MKLDADAIGLVFPGQGAQSVGMAAWLLENHQTARDTFDHASQVLGYDLAALCLSGPAEQLNATQYSQPALFVHSLAASRVLSEDFPDVPPRVKAVAGLSLGEYSAVCYAGGLEFTAALQLVQRRGQAMQEAADLVPSGMASVIGLDAQAVARLCDQARLDGEILQPANLLCRGNIAVSGHLASLENLATLAPQAGASKVIPLSVAGAFHTELMRPAAESLRDALNATHFTALSLPVISNVDAMPQTAGTAFVDLFANQLIAPVRWEESIQKMIQMGINGFIELGTGRVLRGTIKRIDRKIPCEGFGDGPDG